MGPLQGVKVIEFAGIGPAPMCAMLLADLGATVLRIDRPEPAKIGIERPLRFNTLLRNRPSMSLDLKKPESVGFAMELIANSDVLIEGFRPGTMERLGLGPTPCLEVNPRLVYGRMTGWGQAGPLAHTAGHDLNYIALSGALHAIGRKGQPPTPPLNLVGDFGGGAVMLAFGLLAGVIHARTSGVGQVVDAAMLDGAATLMTSFFGMHAAGLLNAERGSNVLDSGSHYYDVYECADGKYLSVAPIESKFRTEFFQLLEISPHPTGGETALRAQIAERIRTRTQSEWQSLFDGTDACVSPVLSYADVAQHPHNKARNVFVEIDGVTQPAPAPRFSATPAQLPTPPAHPDANLFEALSPWGLDQQRIDGLVSRSILRTPATIGAESSHAN